MFGISLGTYSIRMTAAWINSNNEYFTARGSDPFTLTIHFITDPGGSKDFKNLTTPLVKWCDPSFQIFNIAERSKANGYFPLNDDTIPSLCVLLFLEEELDSGLISEIKEYFSTSPWNYHHTSEILDNLCTYQPNEQHFFSTSRDMPLWAVRQVHCGKRYLRFMVYSSSTMFQEMVRFYSLVLNKEPTFTREDNFCLFTVHSETTCDVQFALKKAPKKCPRTLSSAFLQFKVSNIDELIDILPNSCSPISLHRFQTTDPDGNVTLLLVTQNDSRSKLPPRRSSIDVLQYLLTTKRSRHGKNSNANKTSLEPIDDSET